MKFLSQLFIFPYNLEHNGGLQMKRPYINWLITDTHFNDDEMTDICGRPLNCTELIISNLKYVVAEQDVLIHLGDVITGKESVLLDLMSQVKCKTKVLIKGNHDKKSNNWFKNNGFDFICNSLVIDEILLSHKPLKEFPSGVKYNVHGHFHNFDFMKNDTECAPYYNPEVHKLYALEYEDYKPVNLKEFVLKFKKE